MKYTFIYHITALDLWKLSMYGIYSTMIGMTNIIFTIAMLLFSMKFWPGANIFMKILLIIAICLFTVIQPIVIYIKSKQQAERILGNTTICFDDYGVYVNTQNEISKIKWNQIKKVIKKPSMVVMFLETKHGFVLTNKVLGKQKEDFYYYILSRIQV